MLLPCGRSLFTRQWVHWWIFVMARSPCTARCQSSGRERAPLGRGADNSPCLTCTQTLSRPSPLLAEALNWQSTSQCCHLNLPPEFLDFSVTFSPLGSRLPWEERIQAFDANLADVWALAFFESWLNAACHPTPFREAANCPANVSLGFFHCCASKVLLLSRRGES